MIGPLLALIGCTPVLRVDQAWTDALAPGRATAPSALRHQPGTTQALATAWVQVAPGVSLVCSPPAPGASGMTGSLLVLAGADLDTVPNRVSCVLGDTEHTFRVQVDGGSALVPQPTGAAVDCQEPRVRAAGGACCWPGQAGPSCSGPPVCPAPLVGVRDWCELPALSIARTQSVLVEADLVQRCFTEHDVPLALRLPLVLSLRIGPGGQVVSASMEAPPVLDGSEVVACLLRESSALRFPPTDAGGALVYPVAGIPLSESSP